MSIFIFYHINCDINVRTLIKSQIQRIIFSGLYERCEKIYCFLSGDEKIFNTIKMIVRFYGKKFQFVKEENPMPLSGEIMIYMKKLLTAEDKFLYIFGPSKNEYTISWETDAEYNLFTRVDEILEKLNADADIVGSGEISTEPIPHFIQNDVWWSRGSYYLKLPEQLIEEYKYYPYLTEPALQSV